MPVCREISERRSVEWCMELLMQHPGQWPHRDWVGFENVAEAVRRLFAQHLAAPPSPPPSWWAERGVVICGGGWRFFASVYVTVKVLRRVGCTLPVQVWFLGDKGEFDPKMAECLAEDNVGWIDADSWWRENPQYRIRLLQIDHGWMLKPFAVLGCPFREVLSLDADCYPTYNPEVFLDKAEVKRVGAVFWPDMNPLERGQWERFGIQPHNVPGLESGQFFVDKARHWAPLWGACFLNALHDYTWRHVYGDKDTFNLAWRKAGHEMCVPTSRPGFRTHSFLQMDFDGLPLFIHRTRDKFRLLGLVEGEPISSKFETRQLGNGNVFDQALPHERFCFDTLATLDRMLRPEASFDLLGHPGHVDVWNRINRQNEYRFAKHYLPTDVAIDVGGNLGAATNALLERGMGHVITVEPQVPCVERLYGNLRRWGERVNIIHAAAWVANRPAEALHVFRRADDRQNLGNSNCFVLDPHYDQVATISIDWLIRLAAQKGNGRVRLLKIDAEGAEYPCLYTSKLLDQVDEVIGEWHLFPGVDMQALAGLDRPCTPLELSTCLKLWGFEVRLEYFTGHNGLFWATRPPPTIAGGCC